ncbi:MAG TPA: hypothetical protein VFE86_08710 [Ilumatobacteraceae bacterium]|nr:hypothetical protein [Ilumatobacteraceae bacterium]
MPRRNRVDPWGDMHAVEARGMFTGNRGCVVDDNERVVRHHAGSLWIICRTEFRDWRVALARPRRWTPLFFLDDAVALGAGHRPCATCRRADYVCYRDAVTLTLERAEPVRAWEMNGLLAAERLSPGRGLVRAADRKLWTSDIAALPDGTLIVDAAGEARLVLTDRLLRFSFGGWTDPIERPCVGTATVLTPPTSVGALVNGFRPTLHPSAGLD